MFLLSKVTKNRFLWSKCFWFCFLFCGVLNGAVSQSTEKYSQEYLNEYQQLQQQIQNKNDKEVQDRLRKEVRHEASLIRPSDRDPLDVLLRRTQSLLSTIKEMEGSPDLSNLEDNLNALRKESHPLAIGDLRRKQTFLSLCLLKRKIAFENPLLNFENIVFLKHHRARFEHMCDQYYGFRADPGGGVFVLKNAFGNDPQVNELLEHSQIQNGRLQGKTLENGSAISLELSFDGKPLLFAWTEAEVPVKPTNKTPLEKLWKPESTYHVFKVNTDGSACSG